MADFMEVYHNLSPNIRGKVFTHWFTNSSDGYIVSNQHKFIKYPLPLIPAINRTGNSLNILCSRSRELDESHPRFIVLCKLSQNTLDFISGLINLNYPFNMAFKVSLKANKAIINVAFISKFYDGAYLKILHTFSQVFLRHFAKVDMTE